MCIYKYIYSHVQIYTYIHITRVYTFSIDAMMDTAGQMGGRALSALLVTYLCGCLFVCARAHVCVCTSCVCVYFSTLPVPIFVWVCVCACACVDNAGCGGSAGGTCPECSARNTCVCVSVCV